MRIASFICVLLVFGLTSCGFKLKQEWPLSQINDTVVLNGSDTSSQMLRRMERHFVARGVTIGDDPTSVAEIYILDESLERRLLSLFSTGQVAEYDLVFTVDYSIKLVNQQAEVFNYQQIRQYQDDPDRALAKSKERAVILEEMRTTASDEIFRKYLNLSNTVVGDTVIGDTVVDGSMVTHANIQ